jgi:phospholipase C
MRQGGRRPRKLLPPEVFVGTVVDITGHLVAVHSDDSKTIRVSYVKGVVPPELVPGKTVQVTGTLRNGITYDPKIEITGGTPWPPAHAPKPRSGRVEHIFFVIQENHSFDNYFG